MDTLLNLDASTTLVLTGLVMGGVELVKRAFSRDWKATVIIIAAGLVGGLSGLGMGIDFFTGIVFGLSASGYVTLAQNLGKQSTGY